MQALLMISMASSLCMYGVRELTSRLSSSAACYITGYREKGVERIRGHFGIGRGCAELYTVRFIWWSINTARKLGMICEQALRTMRLNRSMRLRIASALSLYPEAWAGKLRGRR
jgi:hypothetical protein